MTGPGPHDAPVTEGIVGSVSEVAPPWHFAPPAENIIADGATRDTGFSGTPTGQSQLGPSTDPHTIPTAKAPGEWRVPG